MTETKIENLSANQAKKQKISYREAVTRSKKLILSGTREEMQPFAKGEHHATVLGLKMLRDETDEFLMCAEHEADLFDLLKLAIAYKVEQGEELPQKAKQWLAGYLRGKTLRPKARAGRKNVFWLHALIWLAVTGRVSDGMLATRNDASEPTSACDAVAEALAELDLEPKTFHGVKRVWLSIQKRKGSTIEAT